MNIYVVEIKILNQMAVPNLKIFQYTANGFFYKRLPCAHDYYKIEAKFIIIF